MSYSFAIALQDYASSGLMKITQQIESMQSKIAIGETKISEANAKAAAGINELNTKMETSKGLAGSLSGALNSMVGMLGAIGISTAFMKIGSMIESGIEKAHEFHAAEAQVKAGLESTGGAAGVTFEMIEKATQKFSAASIYNSAQIMDMQAQMLTFGGLTQENFSNIGQAIINVATKTGTDLHSMSIQFGKAMDNPADGIKKLSRQGVLFSKEQATAIDKLVEKGNIVGAQQIMLSEIANKYGNSAKAAFDANPMARYNKAIGSISKSFGNFVESIQEKLAPYLEILASKGKLLVDWAIKFGKAILDNKGVFMVIIGAIGVYNGIMAIATARTAVMAWYTGLSTSAIVINTLVTEGWSAAWAALNIAMSANPLGIIITVIAALSAAIAYCWNHFGWFRGAVYATWEVLKGVGDIIKNYVVTRINELTTALGNAVQAFQSLKNGDFAKAWDYTKQAGKNLLGMDTAKKTVGQFAALGKSAGTAFNKGVAELTPKTAIKITNHTPKGIKNPFGVSSASDDAISNDKGAKANKESKEKRHAETINGGGSKTTNITIQIQKLGTDTKVYVSSVNEGLKQTGENVAESLLRAINSVNQMQTT